MMQSHHNNNDLCDELYKVAGVRPSKSWLDNRSRNNATSADAVLQEILHQDLRQVVRETGPANNSNTNNNMQVQQLHQLVHSQQPQRQVNLKDAAMKATLPDSFRLMIQVEEVVDVAQPAETRLGNATAAGGGRGQQQRCLRLCISDGYHDNGSSVPNNTPPQQQPQNRPTMAMEVSPIPNLSATTQAGTKMVLHGPIQVRWGVLLLHEGNALVLGGQVPRLVELQAEALAEAKRQAGVGVDPTVRALIWNPDAGEEEEQDEGETDSGDVAQAPTGAGGSALIRSINGSNNNPRPRNSVQNNLQNGSHINAGQQGRRQPLEVSHHVTPPPPNSMVGGANNNRIRPSPPLPTTTLPSQQPPTSAGSRSAASLPTTSSVSTRASQVNPYARAASRQSPAMSGIPASSSSSAPSASSMAATTFTSAVPNNALMAHRRPPAVVQDVIMEEAPTNGPVPATTTTTLSFSGVKSLLLKACQDKAVYEQNYGQVFVVSGMRQVGNHHYFNIDKKSKRKKEKKGDKSKGDKYEYVMHIKCTGSPESEGVISCALSNGFMEPFFGESAGEMRKMRKADGEKIQALISESGKKIKGACQKIGQWEATLYHPTEQFFEAETSPALDGTRPVLLLLGRRDCS